MGPSAASSLKIWLVSEDGRFVICGGCVCMRECVSVYVCVLCGHYM